MWPQNLPRSDRRTDPSAGSTETANGIWEPFAGVNDPHLAITPSVAADAGLVHPRSGTCWSDMMAGVVTRVRRRELWTVPLAVSPATCVAAPGGYLTRQDSAWQSQHGSEIIVATIAGEGPGVLAIVVLNLLEALG